MKFFCDHCGTVAEQPELCTGCGELMGVASSKTSFIVEVVDVAMSNKLHDIIACERRGPFQSSADAHAWWYRHERLPKYFGCVGIVMMVEPVEETEGESNER